MKLSRYIIREKARRSFSINKQNYNTFMENEILCFQRIPVKHAYNAEGWLLIKCTGAHEYLRLLFAVQRQASIREQDYLLIMSSTIP
jgi:hypothetical protein